jgi:hypothetical protein
MLTVPLQKITNATSNQEAGLKRTEESKTVIYQPVILLNLNSSARF